MTGESKNGVIFDIDMLKYHPVLCSPRVSSEIDAYLEAKYKPAQKLADHNTKLLKDGQLVTGLFALIASFIESSLEYHRNVPAAYDAVVDAMCWELGISREEFLGT